MPPWFGKQDGSPYRVFFATDVHGSEPTFRKFINAAKGYGVDALVLGGDISGKMLIPIIDLGAGNYTATLQSTTVSMTTDELPAFEKKLAARHLSAGGLVLYDLSSSYFEGTTCPLAKRGYVDKTPYDTASILRFITRRWNLEPLPGVRSRLGQTRPS